MYIYSLITRNLHQYGALTLNPKPGTEHEIYTDNTDTRYQATSLNLNLLEPKPAT